MLRHYSQPLAIFSAAVPADAELLAEWEKHLLPLQQVGRVTIWSEQHLPAGTPRAEHITRHLSQADIIILLLSSDFFASDECCRLMEQALQWFRDSQITVLPLLLRSSAWRETALGVFSCLPTNGRPVANWNNRDEALQNCVDGILDLLKQADASESDILATDKKNGGHYSEQLYYTWSRWGYGQPGLRIRAASPALNNIKDFNIFRAYLSYRLPYHTDALRTKPEEAPLCLTFVETMDFRERILLQKKYRGQDPRGRPGNFFVHLIAHLPPRSSHNNPLYQSDFLAQDAIELWRAPIWKDSDEHIQPPTYLELPSISESELQGGTLSERDMSSVRDFLPFVIQAFLSLEKHQHLYIAADADIVAALIWGVLHALPRTLTEMQTATFSTFEDDVLLSSATIVGTSWLLQHSQPYNMSDYNLPQECYHRNGLAINCYPHARQFPHSGRSPLPSDTDEAVYARFATTCFLQGEMQKLNIGMDGEVLCLEARQEASLRDPLLSLRLVGVRGF